MIVKCKCKSRIKVQKVQNNQFCHLKVNLAILLKKIGPKSVNKPFITQFRSYYDITMIQIVVKTFKVVDTKLVFLNMKFLL